MELDLEYMVGVVYKEYTNGNVIIIFLVSARSLVRESKLTNKSLSSG